MSGQGDDGDDDLDARGDHLEAAFGVSSSETSQPDEPDEALETGSTTQTNEAVESSEALETDETPQLGESNEAFETLEKNISGERDKSIQGESASDSHETPQPDDSNEVDDTSQSASSISKVQKERKGVQMFLPENLVEKMRQQYKLLDAEHDMEYGEGLEKNRHYYPLIVELGIKQIEDMDVDQVHEKLR